MLSADVSEHLCQSLYANLACFYAQADNSAAQLYFQTATAVDRLDQAINLNNQCVYELQKKNFTQAHSMAQRAI